MKRLVLVGSLPLLFLLTAACTAAATSPARVETAPQLVNVTFESQPRGAEIYVDGVLIGSTDLSYRRTPGVHTVELRREGFAPWRRELTVRAGSPTRLAAMLKSEER